MTTIKKPFLVFKKRKLYATAVRLEVSDWAEHGEYNHPVVVVTLTECPNGPECGCDVDKHHITFKFQRDLRGTRGSATTFLRTQRDWTTCYAGRIELSHSGGAIRVVDQPFKLSHDDQRKAAVARLVARTIYEKDISRDDECEAVFKALVHLAPDAKISEEYIGERGGIRPLREVFPPVQNPGTCPNDPAECLCEDHPVQS